MDQFGISIFQWIITLVNHVDLLMYSMKTFVMLKMLYIMNNMSEFMGGNLTYNMQKEIEKHLAR